MADAQNIIELIFQGVDKTGAATAAAVKNLESFGGSLKGATQPVADFTAAALKVEAGVLAVGAAFHHVRGQVGGGLRCGVQADHDAVRCDRRGPGQVQGQHPRVRIGVVGVAG
jgi:hypothetical protein